MTADHRRLAQLFLRWIATARHRFIAELLLWFTGVWLLCAVAVWLAETGHNPRVHGLSDALYGLLVTMTTSGDSAVAPMTPVGRWVMSLAVLASKLLTALLCALAAAVLIERKVREDMGLKMFNFSDHVVIIGWNMKGPHILRALAEDAELGRRPVVVISDGDSRPMDDPMVNWTRSALPLRGDAPERARLAQALRIIVLANYAEKTHADALSAVNVMMARTVNPSAGITVELLDPAQRPYLEAAGATDIVGIGEVGGFLLAEAAAGGVQTREFLASLAARGRRRQDSARAAEGSPGCAGSTASKAAPSALR